MLETVQVDRRAVQTALAAITNTTMSVTSALSTSERLLVSELTMQRGRRRSPLTLAGAAPRLSADSFA